MLNCVDLFAGAGGFSLAAKNIGLTVVAAVEFDTHACETYRHNIVGEEGATTLYHKDIRELNPRTIKKAHFHNSTTCDLVLGGPPCQGFSVHRINDAGVDDPRNQLVLRYFEFVRVLKPKAFLMENVPGLLWERHRKFLDKLYEEGKKANYRMFERVLLDARDFGVPQRRKRVFILGVHKDVDFDTSVWPPQATHGDERQRKESPKLLPWVTAEKAKIFRGAPKDDTNDVHMMHTEQLVKVFMETPANGGSRHDSGRTLLCHIGHGGHNDVYGRINPKEPGPTMTTACINPSKGRFVHPVQHHGITVRQAARFQTFPDDYVFKGGLMAAGAQIGNAVPIKLGEVLLRAVAEGLSCGR